jgi:serine/threonine-protein kinase RsbW
MNARIGIDLEIVIPTQTRYLSLIGNIGEQLAHDLLGYKGDRDLLAFNLNLVLTEALANAIQHAGQCNPTVRVCIHIEETNLCIQVHDRGCGFDLEQLPCHDPDETSERGRGIFIIRALMDTVDYRKTENGNVLEMKKNLA